MRGGQRKRQTLKFYLLILKKLGIATSSEGNKRTLLELLILKRGKESNIIVVKPERNNSNYISLELQLANNIDS